MILRATGSDFWCDDQTDPSNPVWAVRTISSEALAAALEGPALIISKVGSTFQAKDGQTKAIRFSGSVFTTVMQSAVDYLGGASGGGAGGTILLTQGAYTVGATTVSIRPGYTSTLAIVGEGPGTVITLTSPGVPSSPRRRTRTSTRSSTSTSRGSRSTRTPRRAATRRSAALPRPV